MKLSNFVNDTHVDALAIAVGTLATGHKFTRPPTDDILSIARIKEIHARIPNTHLVMHGSSGVPQEWLKVINENGGNIGETYGVPVEQIVEAIKHGVRKNIDTDFNINGCDSKIARWKPNRVWPRKIFYQNHRYHGRFVCRSPPQFFGG